MRALSYHGPDHVEIIDLPVPSPGDGEALIRVEASAICGSELHGDSPPPNGGHEAAGVIEHAPSGSDLEVGERVGVSAVTGCGNCDHCHAGVQLYCRNGAHIQTGMHADYVVAPVGALRRLPRGISARDAVLISGDTLGVPARAHRRVPSTAGQRVLILGLGPIGLGHTLVRAHDGADITAVEPSEYRRELARKLGARRVLSPGEDLGPAPSLVIECTGLPDLIRFAMDTVDAGGTVLQSGECGAVELNPSDTVIRREITYTGTWYYADEDAPELIRLYERGLPVGDLVTHEFPATDAAQAYRTFVAKTSGKIVLHWA
jgi:threonine dehydrogenase-like Zn-dependent dehydrogenase